MTSKGNSDGVVVGADDLTTFTARIFSAAGMPERSASLQAEILVWANLHGVDSHGVLRVPWYIGRIDAGDMIPDATASVASEMPGTALLDAHGAPGPVATLAAVEAALAKAREVGVAWIVVRGLMHNGALGYYTEKIAREGFLGITTVCSPPNMAPHGAKAAGLHNSPISIGIPASGHPVILDMATSVAAGGKIYFAADRGIPIPEGWALDASGRSTTDPNTAKIWLPFEGPKGSGLAMMFECWSSLLANNALCAPQMAGVKKDGDSFRQNAMVCAVNVSAFMDPDAYRAQVDDLVTQVKQLPPAGNQEILVPGERETAEAATRAASGIPLPQGTVGRIAPVAERFGVPVPWRGGLWH